MTRPVIATDPGKNGGVVWGRTLEDLQWEKIPNTPQGILELYTDRIFLGLDCPMSDGDDWPVAWVERNTGFMGGIKSSTKRKGEEDSDEGGVSPKAMYSFGINTGHIEMAHLASRFEISYATPIKWMNAARIIRAGKKNMTPTQWKNFLKDAAIERFPHVRVTLANCDALLIYHAAITGALR